jgi:hypothetical protein
VSCAISDLALSTACLMANNAEQDMQSGGSPTAKYSTNINTQPVIKLTLFSLNLLFGCLSVCLFICLSVYLSFIIQSTF